MTGAVPIWETDRSLHPTLTIVAASSARDLAQALAAGLEGAGYELHGVTPESFSARHADRVIVKILKPVEATVLEVAVSAGVAQHPQFVQATIRVCGGTQRRSGVRSASAGLSQAVATIEHRGVEVKVRPWDYDTAGSADDEVPGWDKYLRSFHPQMTVRSPTAAPTVVDALARSLQGAGYKVSRRSGQGFGPGITTGFALAWNWPPSWGHRPIGPRWISAPLPTTAALSSRSGWRAASSTGAHETGPLAA